MDSSSLNGKIVVLTEWRPQKGRWRAHVEGETTTVDVLPARLAKPKGGAGAAAPAGAIGSAVRGARRALASMLSSGKDANLQEAETEQDAAQQADVAQSDDFISRLEQAETRDARRTADKT